MTAEKKKITCLECGKVFLGIDKYYKKRKFCVGSPQSFHSDPQNTCLWMMEHRPDDYNYLWEKKEKLASMIANIIINLPTKELDTAEPRDILRKVHEKYGINFKKNDKKTKS